VLLSTVAYQLTYQQFEALKALDWLFDEREDLRRQGRTLVLALSYVMRALAHPGEWVVVRDHIPTLQARQELLQLILHWARGAGATVNADASGRIMVSGSPDDPSAQRLAEYVRLMFMPPAEPVNRRTAWERLDVDEE
jgi:hypothetical protein